VVDQRDDEREVKDEEGLPIKELKVERVVQKVEPEAQQGRIEEAINLALSFE